MLRTFLLFPLLLLQHPFQGQEELRKHEYHYFVGLRYLHYGNCIECYFEPSEWEVPNTTMGLFTGIYMRRSRGFTLSMDCGNHKVKVFSNGVNTLDGESARYNETLYHYRRRYVNLSLGHTFGRNRLRFSTMFGLDYVFQKQYRIEGKSSYYRFMDSPVLNKYPDIEPDGISRYSVNTQVRERGILPFISASLRYEFYKNISGSVTVEIPVAGRSSNIQSSASTRRDIYRLTFAYRFASTVKKSRKAKTQ